MSKPSLGTVYLVGAGPGDAGLLTLRGAELLARADVIFHDAILNLALLRHARIGAEIIPVGKRGGSRLLAQPELNRLLIEKARAGLQVVRLKGGDPYIFGRGGEEAGELADAGIPFEVVPGVSSFSAVASAAGIPLTHREHASTFTVGTGHEDPEKPGASVNWRSIARTEGTKVVLMGVERIGQLAAELVEGGLPASTPVAMIRWGTMPNQQTITGTLADIADRLQGAGFTAPAVAVIGDVVKLRSKLNWFEQRSLFGRRVVVTRSREQAAALSARLAELGAEVLEIPTIRIEPPSERLPMVEALAGLGEYDWVVFSSPHGVSAFFGALLAAYEDVRAVGTLRIAAVGPATAARVREFHLRVDAMPAEFLGSKIADAMVRIESLENVRVLVARAQVANTDLCRQLEDRGAIVDDIAFYRTSPEPPDASDTGALLLETGADWITFTSGSTVGSFHARFDLPALLARHPRIRLASIGPETSQALRKLGVAPAAEANPHTIDGLVQALKSSGAPK